jgi:exopolysaccharide biosynthesis polyprenyl glycosylphosphotransferase
VFDSELRRQKTLYAAADGVAVSAAVLLAAVVNDRRHAVPCMLCAGNFDVTLAMTALVSLIWVLNARAFKLYEPGNRWAEELIVIGKASAVATLIALALNFLAHEEPLPRLTAGLAFGLSLVTVPLSRLAVRAIIAGAYAHPRVSVPLVVIGFNPTAHYVCDQVLDLFPQYELLGFLDDQTPPGTEYRARRVLGGLRDIATLAGEHRNLEAVIILPDAGIDTFERAIRFCERHEVRWRVMPWLVGSLTSGIKVDSVGVVPLIGPLSSNIEGLNFIFKRGFDLVVGSLVLVAAAPVMLLAAGALWLCDGRPLLFRQTRIGLHGETFDLLKFRTMQTESSDELHRAYVQKWIGENGAAERNPNGAKVFKLTADPRVTTLGRWLRRLSLDELPQLINVLRGEMSLIGPRPALPYELTLYQDWHRRRLGALPGITGLWQVSGRNGLSFDQMVRLDIKYIQDWSFGEDVRILMRTVPALFRGH